MIEPIESEDENESTCCVVVEVRKVKDVYSYEYHLILNETDFVTLAELQTLKKGLAEALLGMEKIVDVFERDDE